MIEKSDHTQRLIISLPEYMYMIAIVLNIFLRSMFNFGRWGTYISYIPIVIMVSYCLYKQSFNYKWFLWLILGITISIGTKSLQCLFIILLIFVSPFIDINKIMRQIVTIVFTCLFIIYMSTVVGIIPNLILVRNGITRMAMGTQFPLVFSTYILYSCIYLTLMYYKRYPIKLSVLLLGIVFFLDKVTNSRNDELCILALIVVIGINKLRPYIKKVIINIAYIVTFLLIFISIFITKLVPYSSNIYNFMDELFSGRLSLQYILLEYYSPLLWGQNIPQQGFGGEQQTVNNYFYIDNSYARILFMYGIIFFLFLMMTLGFRIYKYGTKRAYMLGIILLIILVSGISADSFSLLTQNMLILPLFFINDKSVNYLDGIIN